jgi:hypothetical protein
MRARVTVDFGAQPAGYWRNLREAASQLLAAVAGLDCNLSLSAHCGRWQSDHTPLLRHAHRVPNLFMSIPRLARGRGIDHEHCLRAWRNLI